jgi:hypothetical protein
MPKPKKSKEEIMAEMNAAAEVARSDFLTLKNTHPEATLAVGQFFLQHYLTAGYKRLAHMFMYEGG